MAILRYLSAGRMLLLASSILMICCGGTGRVLDPGVEDTGVKDTSGYSDPDTGNPASASKERGGCPGHPTEGNMCPVHCVKAYELTEDTPIYCVQVCTTSADCITPGQGCAPEGYCLPRCTHDWDCKGSLYRTPRCDQVIGTCTFEYCQDLPVAAGPCPEGCLLVTDPPVSDTPLCAQPCTTSADCSLENHGCTKEGYCLRECEHDLDCSAGYLTTKTPWQEDPRCDHVTGFCSYRPFCPGWLVAEWFCPEHCAQVTGLSESSLSLCAQSCTTNADCSDETQGCAPEGTCLPRCSANIACPYSGADEVSLQCEVELGVCSFSEA